MYGDGSKLKCYGIELGMLQHEGGHALKWEYGR